MASPHPSHPIEFRRIHYGKWSATALTPDGPVMAIGETMGDARRALDAVLMIARALEVTHRESQ